MAPCRQRRAAAQMEGAPAKATCQAPSAGWQNCDGWGSGQRCRRLCLRDHCLSESGVNAPKSRYMAMAAEPYSRPASRRCHWQNPSAVLYASHRSNTCGQCRSCGLPFAKTIACAGGGPPSNHKQDCRFAEQHYARVQLLRGLVGAGGSRPGPAGGVGNLVRAGHVFSRFCVTVPTLLLLQLINGTLRSWQCGFARHVWRRLWCSPCRRSSRHFSTKRRESFRRAGRNLPWANFVQFPHLGARRQGFIQAASATLSAAPPLRAHQPLAESVPSVPCQP